MHIRNRAEVFRNPTALGIMFLMVTALMVVALARLRTMCVDGTAREIRLRADVSLAEIADAIGSTPVTVSRWERGMHSPRGEAAARYLELLTELDGAAVTPA